MPGGREGEEGPRLRPRATAPTTARALSRGKGPVHVEESENFLPGWRALHPSSFTSRVVYSIGMFAYAYLRRVGACSVQHTVIYSKSANLPLSPFFSEN